MARLRAELLERKSSERVAVIKLEDGTELPVQYLDDVIPDSVGETFDFTIFVSQNRVTAGAEEPLGIEPAASHLSSRVVGEVTGYDVGDEWPEVESTGPSYPLVELDVGVGKVVFAHHNVPPKEERQAHHEEGARVEIVAKRLMVCAADR